MLALLVPWREISMLKEDNTTWQEAFNNFYGLVGQHEKNVLAAIQYYYECKSTAATRREGDVGDEYSPIGTTDNEQNGNREVEEVEEMDDESESMPITLTEDDLHVYEESQKSQREEAHASAAIAIACSKAIFAQEHHQTDFTPTTSHVGLATGSDYSRLQKWEKALMNDAHGDLQLNVDGETDLGNITLLPVNEDDEYGAHTALLDSSIYSVEEYLTGVDPSDLLVDQRRAYDIIDWHLHKSLTGGQPDQLLMIIPGEGGVGKSKTIQSISEKFRTRGVSSILVKGAYTGIAASLIDGKTLHVLGGISVNGREPGPQTLKKLAIFWKGRRYLIIDEKSMISRWFFARLSKNICKGLVLAGEGDPNLPFGGLNVILVGDFHQFPPVASKKTAPLYYPCSTSIDSADDMLGRSIYEQFTVVVRLKEQVRVTDPEWVDLLQNVRRGSCRAHHIELLRSLIVTDPRCPPTDFNLPPWDNHILITPRHAVRRQWNLHMTKKACQRNGAQLFICNAFDTIQGRSLTLSERFSVATKPRARRGQSDERGGLAKRVFIAIGMEVMVTFNIDTDIDVANGSRGYITDIILNESERKVPSTEPVVELEYLPAFVLVKMNHTKAATLDGLEQGVLPLVPLERTFKMIHCGREQTVTRRQLPLTTSYAFTDYRSQGQTISAVLIDIGTPPTGQLTPFNIYVALSRSRGRDTIRLLRDFDERLLTSHPSEYLRMEDARLVRMDEETQRNWEEKKRRMDDSHVL
jgi:hypothetical protein